MSLRTFQRVTIMSILALGALGASGCDDDETTESDGGGGGNGNGNGNGNGGEKDANGGVNDGTNDGIDGDVPFEGIMCETESCPKTKGGLLQQCCAGEGEDVCGLDLTAPGQPSLGCFPEKAPGKASASCAAVLNTFETMGTKADKFEIDAGGMIIEFPTCCTAAGICGVDSGATSLGDLGLGCLAATVLAPAPDPTADAAPPVDDGTVDGKDPTMGGLPLIPNVFCDATTGVAGSCIPAMVPGQDGTPTKVPPFIKGACPAEIKDGCIVNVEKNIEGCGEADADKWDRKSLQTLCIDKVAKGIYGCDDVTLSRLPSIACGCGVGVSVLAGAPVCLKNTALNVCGTRVGCTGVPTMAMPNPVDSCAGPDSCADVAPFTSTKDGVGDACGCQPALDTDGPGDNMPPFDTCNPTGAAAGTAAGAFDCVQVAPGQNRCSCGTVGMVGTCAPGSICTDTDMNRIGDTCVVTPPT